MCYEAPQWIRLVLLRLYSVLAENSSALDPSNNINVFACTLVDHIDLISNCGRLNGGVY